MDWYYLIGVIALAIPAAIVDAAARSRLSQLETRVKELEEWITILNDQNKKLKEEINKDVHEHVRKLVSQIQTLETEIKALKQ
jgi:septal ring factor EnvC (AmiA/AmiB activator)